MRAPESRPKIETLVVPRRSPEVDPRAWIHLLGGNSQNVVAHLEKIRNGDVDVEACGSDGTKVVLVVVPSKSDRDSLVAMLEESSLWQEGKVPIEPIVTYRFGMLIIHVISASDSLVSNSRLEAAGMLVLLHPERATIALASAYFSKKGEVYSVGDQPLKEMVAQNNEINNLKGDTL